ncbi:patatin-like phospholipase family protein [Sphingomonas sp. DT-51]
MRVVLLLSGGNALGAYQAGAYEAMQEAGLAPDLVTGASIGAINGALVCGNPPDRRLSRLRTFWSVDEDDLPSPTALSFLEDWRRTTAALTSALAGQPGRFSPRHLFGTSWNPLGNLEPASLYDSAPLGATLERLVDFDLLQAAAPPLTITAVDLETGDDVVFDTRTHDVGPDHLRASSALLPAFPPVQIGDRLLGDGGLSANLPLDPVLSENAELPTLCLALDLLPLRARRPATLGETLSRAQDLQFATQSRRVLAAWQAILGARAESSQNASAPIFLLHLAYDDQAREVSGKAFDFSKASVAARWRSGLEDMRSAIEWLDRSAYPFDAPGLTVLQPIRSAAQIVSFESVRLSLSPSVG